MTNSIPDNKKEQYAILLLPALLFITTLVLFAQSRAGEHLHLIINSDAEGYFQYLPYFFIKGDLQHLPYAVLLDNGNTLNTYHIGVAILQLPFFLGAHLVAVLAKYPLTGFSPPYLYGIAFAGSFYHALGAFFLLKTIRRHFNSAVAVITVICITFGTNLLFYTSFEPGMSHVYSFFLFSWFIYQVENYLSKPVFSRAMLMGVTLGLIAVVRPSNLVMALCIPLFAVSSFRELKTRLQLLVRNPLSMIFLAGTFLITLTPQLLYWRHVTGNIIVFTYGIAGQGFNWLSPVFLKVLFSPQNGWLVYSPVMLAAVLGLALTLRKGSHHSYAIVAVTVIALYIFSSWWAWWFGAAYGHRAFVEYYALLGIPFACVVDRALASQKKFVRIVLALVPVMAIYLNMKMCFLYNPPWDGPGWGWDDYLMILRQVFN